MAFEIPLDADRVDDMNLFSTLVRAPVIGTLLWILGGSKAREEEESGNDQRLDDDDDHDVRNNSSSSNGEYRQTRSSLKKAAPSLAASEISECDIADSLDAVSLYGYGGSSVTHCIPGMTKKELSWSDDAGRDLVIYETESSTIHEPLPASEQPVRPALVRSRSIRSDANALAKSQQLENKYLPRSNKTHVKHHSMPFPSGHNPEPYSSGTNGGYDSPQWGWYINTTPPSPEMFHSSRSMKASRKPTDSTSDTSETSRESAFSGGSSMPNPVFQCLQDKHKAAPTGWPSVPL